MTKFKWICLCLGVVGILYSVGMSYAKDCTEMGVYCTEDEDAVQNRLMHYLKAAEAERVVCVKKGLPACNEKYNSYVNHVVFVPPMPYPFKLPTILSPIVTGVVE